MPEKVEKEITDILSRDWKSLADSCRPEISGQLNPLRLELSIGDVSMFVERVACDSVGLGIPPVSVIAPKAFLFKPGQRASLLYEEQRVGYITLENFENTDYSTGNYLLIRYYGDPRSFAIYDNGLCGLLKINLEDVFK